LTHSGARNRPVERRAPEKRNDPAHDAEPTLSWFGVVGEAGIELEPFSGRLSPLAKS